MPCGISAGEQGDVIQLRAFGRAVVLRFGDTLRESMPRDTPAQYRMFSSPRGRLRAGTT
jgi:hypothetical protein